MTNHSVYSTSINQCDWLQSHTGIYKVRIEASLMRHPAFMAALADRVGDIEGVSSFIIIFLVVTVVTALWNDVSRHTHVKQQQQDAEQSEIAPSKQDFLRQMRDESHERI